METINSHDNLMMIEITKTMQSIQDQLSRITLEQQGKWNESHDMLLKLWRKQASINLWLQLASNYYYTRMNDYLTYPAIIVSAATSIGVFGSDDSLKGKFAISILALLSGILTAINKHCRAAEKGQEYALRAKDYYTFIREIDFILSTSKEERPSMTETLERVKSAYDRIVDMQMEPPIHVIRDYEKKFRPLANSLFTDLQEELRVADSTASSISDRDKSIAKTRRTTSLTSPSPRKDPPTSPFNEFNLREARVTQQQQSKIFVQQQKKQMQKTKNAIFSPYQLFGSNPMRLDEFNASNLTTQPSVSCFPTDQPRPSLDGRLLAPKKTHSMRYINSHHDEMPSYFDPSRYKQGQAPCIPVKSPRVHNENIPLSEHPRLPTVDIELSTVDTAEHIIDIQPSERTSAPPPRSSNISDTTR